MFPTASYFADAFTGCDFGCTMWCLCCPSRTSFCSVQHTCIRLESQSWIGFTPVVLFLSLEGSRFIPKYYTRSLISGWFAQKISPFMFCTDGMILFVTAVGCVLVVLLRSKSFSLLRLSQTLNNSFLQNGIPYQVSYFHTFHNKVLLKINDTEPEVRTNRIHAIISKYSFSIDSINFCRIYSFIKYANWKNYHDCTRLEKG